MRRGQHGLAPFGHEPGAGAAVGEVLRRERELVGDGPAQLGLADGHAGRERLGGAERRDGGGLGAEAAREAGRAVRAPGGAHQRQPVRCGTGGR